MSRNVVLGFLGTQLDSGVTPKRWERWRPTVSLAAQADLPVDRLELFTFKAADAGLADIVKADVATLSPGVEVAVHNLALDDPWSFPSVYAALHEFARGYEFAEDTNYYVHLSTGTHVAQICLFLLTEARYFPGKLLGTRKGEPGSKPWQGRAEVIDLDLSTYDQLSSRFRREQDGDLELLKGGIVTRNAAFNELIARIEKVSLRSTAPILLTGPTGAGKSQLAARIHALRARKNLAGTFVEVNCATLRGENAMSTLFGHKKGAYTGATADRPGLLRTADGGILFLDEIGELALDEQAMLLRALEHKRFMPLGADKEVESRFQLLAGTNKDLAAEVAKGTFRADLLARINMWTFELPGLAARPEDIEPNLDFELECASEELGTKVSMNSEARAAYLAFSATAPWPGNFRDFKASVARMATLCAGGRIRLTEVTDECAAQDHQNRFFAAAAVPQPSRAPFGRALPTALAHKVLGTRAAECDHFDLVQLEAVLQAVDAARSLAEAGRQLFSVSRQGKMKNNDSSRLKKYLARFGLEFLEVKLLLGAS